MNFLLNIKEKRRDKGFSQKEMAEKLNITTSTYQKIEQNIISLSIERFLEICQILEIDSYNDILPVVNKTIVDEIEKMLSAGSMAFDNIRNNARYSREMLNDLIEKAKDEPEQKTEFIKDLEFIESYLVIISNDSFNHESQFNRIRKLLEKID